MKKILFLSSGVPDAVTETLSDKFEIRKLPPCPELAGPVSTHADMLLGVLDGRIVVTRSYFDGNKDLFSGCGVIITDEHHGKKYPSDVLFNFIDAGDTAVGYKKALTKAKKIWRKPIFTGGDPQLSSAMSSLTSVFGMGTGGTSHSSSPEK